MIDALLQVLVWWLLITGATVIVAGFVVDEPVEILVEWLGRVGRRVRELWRTRGLLLPDRVRLWWGERPWNHCLPGCERCASRTCLPRARLRR